VRIELEGVGKRFGRLQALRDVDLEIASGSRVALIGPNGSGKSTLTRVLMGLSSCTGRVSLDGRSPHERSVELARQLAYVPQVAPSLGAPVGELVRAIRRVRGLDAGAVSGFAGELGLDLGDLAQQPFRVLSGGTKQKLLLALALAARASLVILDEPTASLDVRSRERFFEIFERTAGEATLVLCSHRLEEIRRLVDQVVVLEEGRLAWRGSADEFLATRAYSVVEIQLREPGDEARAGWLRGQGFRHGLDGWWSLQARREQAVRTVTALGEALGGDLLDVIVRPLERVEPEAQAREEGDAA
jgi:ABC-2 type transport system ATP-binding protein